MGLEYGNVVVLVRKTRDGAISRVNAFVLGTAVHTPLRADRSPVLGEDGNPVAPAEHPDLIYCEPTAVPPGQSLKTRVLENFLRHAYDVAPYADGSWIGWEPLAPVEVEKLVEVAPSDYEQLKADLARVQSLNAQMDLARRAQAMFPVASANFDVAGSSGVSTSAPSEDSATKPEGEAAEGASMGAASSAAPASEEDPPASD